MASYHVKYRVRTTTAATIMNLEGGTESEAIAKLKQTGAVQKDADVIILSIVKR